jgi:hypothetical protein
VLVIVAAAAFEPAIVTRAVIGPVPMTALFTVMCAVVARTVIEAEYADVPVTFGVALVLATDVRTA